MVLLNGTYISPRLNHGVWVKHVMSPTRNNSKLELIFIFVDHQGSIYFGSKFPESDRRIVYGWFRVHDSFAKYPIDITRLNCFNCQHLAALLCQLDWARHFLTADPQRASTAFYCNMASCNLELIICQRITRNRNWHLKSLKAKYITLQRHFSLTIDISKFIFLQHIWHYLLRKKEGKSCRHQNHPVILSILYKVRLHDSKPLANVLTLPNLKLLTTSKNKWGFQSVFRPLCDPNCSYSPIQITEQK